MMSVFQCGGDLVLSDEADLHAAQETGRWILVEEGQEDVHVRA